MAKKHKQWHTIIGYFDDISKAQEFHIRSLIDVGNNVLIMIRKKDEENARDMQEVKYKNLRKIFKDEIAKNTLVLSTVPDIKKVGFFE